MSQVSEARFSPARPSFWRQTVSRALAATLPRRLLLVSGPRRDPSVCLTFDDGPHPEHTPALLEVLQQEGVRATFFVVGQEAARYPDLVRRMVAEGHVLGHHSYSHANPQRTSSRQLLAEVRRTLDLLTGMLGKPPTLFRPPHGKLTACKLSKLWLAGQTVVLWNVDPKDFACENPQGLEDWFQTRPLRAGDVVLMHDNHPHASSVVPALVRQGRERGLEFTTPLQWLDQA